MAAGHAFPHLADEEDRKNSENCGYFRRSSAVDLHGNEGFLTTARCLPLLPYRDLGGRTRHVGDTRDALRRAP